MFDDTLTNIFESTPDATALWGGDYKIPWNDPEFSKRMLREHLTQDHDLASRKREFIETQSRWLGELMPVEGSVLDLGCGPGLYARELAERGHRVRGIDFGPASIDYARDVSAGDGRCSFVLSDVQSADFGGDHDLVMMIYGELNVFPKTDVANILSKAFDALKPGGRTFLEVHTWDAVQAAGEGAPSWYKAPAGLFSDEPHLCLMENNWFAELAVAQQHFHVVDAATAGVSSYRSTMQAYSEADYRRLLTGAGFVDVTKHEDWPGSTDALMAMSGVRPG